VSSVRQGARRPGASRHPLHSQCLLTAEAQSMFTPMSEYIFV
jgi:hypothetical protein